MPRCHARLKSRIQNPKSKILLLSTLLACAAQGFANAQVNVVMRHNNSARTAQNLAETTLTTANVKPATFGKLFSLPTDGDVYAQPLYLSNLAIPGKGTHNVVFIATVNNTLYAYDADDSTGVLYWKVNLGPQVPANFIASQNLPGGTGIVSTPAIDLTTKTIYVCNKDYFNGNIAFHLHALDVTTGAEKLGGPVAIAATVNGTGDGNDGAGHIPFNPQQHNNRTAITLANGNVYVVFASHEDRQPYHGWVMSYNAATLAQNGVHITTPGGSEGGIWMSGEGLTVDSAGKLYYVGGNGTFDGKTNLGMGIVKLNGDTSVADWFAPSNTDYLNSIDFDLGTSGAMQMPGTNYLIAGSKNGVIYVLNPANMGKFNSNGDTQIVQEWQASPGHIHSSMTLWNSPTNGTTLYVFGERDYLKAYKFNNTTGVFNTTPFMQSANSVFPGYTNGPGVALSANGTTAGSGIVWTTEPLLYDTVARHAPGLVRAYDASDLTKQIWNSGMNAGDDIGDWAKFVPPVIANGKVYIGSFNNLVHVYGVLPAAAPPAPANPLALASNALVSLSWDITPRTATYTVQRANAATGPFTAIATGLAARSYNDSNVTNGTTYYYRILSVNAYGSAPSVVVAATPTAPVIGNGDGLLGTFYTGSNADWSSETGTPTLVRIDPTINYNLNNGGVGYNAAPFPANVPTMNYTAVWTGQFLPPYTGSYLFQTISDDGARLSVNGSVLFNDQGSHGPLANTSAAVSLVAGQKVPIQLEYFQGGGGETIQLLCSLVGGTMSIIPQSQLYSNVTTPPTVPTLTASPGNATVSLNWTAPALAFQYTVQRGLTASGPFTVIAADVSGTNYRDTGLANGKTYYYQVAAVNSAGSSAYSNTASATPTNVVSPLAYWRFEDGTAAAHFAVPPFAEADSAGKNNRLQTPAAGAAPTFVADSPGIPAGLTANSLSMDFTEAPNGSATRSLITAGGTGDLNTHTFNQFTIEASVKFTAFGGYQTFVGKDGQNFAGDGNGANAGLYFQSPDPGATGGNSVISIRTHQADGTFIIINGTTALTTGTWYNVAATMDGATLKLYLQSTPGGAYNLEGSAPFVGPMLSQNTTWSVGRGFYGGGATDQLRGRVDEVRISDTALDPSQFLFATTPTSTVSGRIALEGVSDMTAVSSAAPTGIFAVIFRQPGTLNPLFSGKVSLTPVGAGSPFGAFSIPFVPAGTYDIAIKGTKNLRVAFPGVIIGAGTATVPDANLPAADANGDNSVDSTDFTALIGAFNSAANVPGSGYDSTADFNFDGAVDSSDFTLLIGEFNNTGAN